MMVILKSATPASHRGWHLTGFRISRNGPSPPTGSRLVISIIDGYYRIILLSRSWFQEETLPDGIGKTGQFDGNPPFTLSPVPATKGFASSPWGLIAMRLRDMVAMYVRQRFGSFLPPH
jgi:hypothetical protein